MDSSPAEILLYLLPLLSFTLLTQARLHADPSDSSAFLLFKKELGLNGQLNRPNELCNSTGVSCERRIYRNNPPVLRITEIIIDSLRLDGSLSPAIGRFSELKELSLPNNQLVGRIPAEIVDCRKLEVLNLRNNRFSGKIPPEFSYLVRLRILDLSMNQFSGDLSFLKYFPNLETLSLSENLFSGKIPASLKSFRNLKHLNLSGNEGLQSSVMTSVNEVEDYTLPKRYIFAENSTKKSNSTKSSSSLGQSPAPAPAPSVPHKTQQKHKRNFKGCIIGFAAGVVGGVVSGFVLSVLFKVVMILIKGRKKEQGPIIFSPLIKNAEDLAFLEKEDGLASLEVIGKGGCGEVYKAELPGSNGKLIAIKKVIQPSMDAADMNDEDSKLLNKKMRQIRSEIQTVGQIRHRSLLPLLAHVSRPDCHYLVYEYMKNGSLQDALKSDVNGDLNWLVRHKIAVGIAEGLEYLHMNHNPRIIHRDLKPGNILLDDDMEARIADFGLAKPIPDAQTHITTSNVAGTVGYIAPEYHQTLKFTDKCDIYSFGVLLAVLVTGKLPSDEFFQQTDEMSQVRWLRNVMTSENPRRAIDPALMGNGFEEQMLLVLKIACFCTLEDPKQRPNSKDIRCMLTQINH